MDKLNNGIRDLNPGEVPYESERKLRSYLTSFLKDRMTRRELLRVGGLSGLSVSALWALACQPAAPAPTPTKAPVAVAPTPTKAPAVAAPTPVPVKEVKRGGILVNYLFRPPVHFSSIESTTFVITWPMQNVHSQLFYFDPSRTPEGPDTILPDLAESWEWSKDGLALTVRLRRGVKWHDGKPFTSKDVKWTMDSVLEKPTGGKFEVNARKPWMAGVDSVEAPDEYTVRFNLQYPRPSLVALLASAFFPIYPEHIKPITKMQTVALGTGPFRFKEYRPGELLVLERNPDFYLPGLPYLDGIRFPIITDLSTRIAAVAAGQVDLSNALDLTATAVKDLKSRNPALVVMGGVTTLQDRIIFNTKRPPFDDARLRRAVLLSLDRDAWNRVAYEGHAVPSTTFLHEPYGAWGLAQSEVKELIKPDLDKAKQLLRETGVKVGPELEVHHRPFPPSEALALWFIDAIRALGLRGKALALEPAVKAARFEAGDFDLSVDAAGYVVDDPDEVLLRYYACAGAHFPVIGFCDQKLDKMVLEQSRETDPMRRKQQVNEIDRYIVTNAIPSQIIGFQPDWQAMQPYVKGYVKKQVIHNQSRFERIWLDK